MQTAAKDIDEEITRLNRIVTEVLDFARPIKFDLAPADLNALARDAVRAAEAAAGGERRSALDSRSARCRRSRPTPSGCARRCVNIVGNAIQAVRPARRAAEASGCGPCALDARRVAITVSDNGSGIAPEDLPRLFDPYFTTRRTGTGIGLAISRNIIEGLGGRITVASERDRGTEVRIELPLDAPDRMTKTTGSILLVDDEAKIRERAGRGAARGGPRGRRDRQPARGAAAAAARVVRRAARRQPDAGADRPRSDPRAGRDDRRPADRPQILLMTAHATVESAIEAMKLGALDYLQKPFEIDELLVVVNRALDHQRLRTQHGYLLSERDEEFNQYGIVGRSRRVQDVIRTARDGGEVEEHGAHHRRDRHRQGNGRARDSLPQRAARDAAGEGELRRASRKTCWNRSCSATCAAPSPAR